MARPRRAWPAACAAPDIAVRRVASSASASNASSPAVSPVSASASSSIRGAGGDEHLGVDPLVIVGGGRQRNRGPTAGRRPSVRQSSSRRRGRRRGRRLHLARHVEQERLDAGFDAGAPVAVPHEVQVALSCLMRDCQPAGCGCQPRRRLHHGHVDRVRALGAAKDQNPRRPAGRRVGVASKNSGRTGLPVTNPSCRKTRASTRRSPPRRRQTAPAAGW